MLLRTREIPIRFRRWIRLEGWEDLITICPGFCVFLTFRRLCNFVTQLQVTTTHIHCSLARLLSLHFILDNCYCKCYLGYFSRYNWRPTITLLGTSMSFKLVFLQKFQKIISIDFKFVNSIIYRT